MKPVGQEMVDLIISKGSFAVAEYYDVQFNDGNHDYFTDLDFDISDGVNTYKSNSLRFEGLRFKIAVGLEVDEQELRVSAYPGETIGGANFFNAVHEGLLDGAYVTRKRGFWVANSRAIFNVYIVTPPVAIVTLFVGRVASIDKIGRTHVEMKLKSPLSLLDVDMPRNSYSPSCLWTLFDQGCTLSKSAFTFSGTIIGGNDGGLTVGGGIPDPVGADGLATYALGRLLFTSGALSNLQVAISTNDANNIIFAHPPVSGFAGGDTFQAWPGCSKSTGTCSLKFGNIANFRGFPRVPPVAFSA